MANLKPLHTFALNSTCRAISLLRNIGDISSCLKIHDSFFLLGEGSNTLFIEDFDGQIILNQIKGIEVTETKEHVSIRVGAGENWHNLVHHCLSNGWYGMENLALIPGSVGASPIQNIGAYGLEVNQFIKSVEFVVTNSGERVILNNHECNFGYRNSIFKHELLDRVVITHVNFKLPKDVNLETSYGELSRITQPSPQKIFEEVIRIRREKLPDPSINGNAGSFFKNPIIDNTHFARLQEQFPNIPHFHLSDDNVKIPAAWLLDTLKFKGRQLGGVECHPRQPLVLVNKGSATGDDVLAFTNLIIDEVLENFAIQLEPEVRLVGKHGLIQL